jgi:hypothetical protein
MRKLICGAVVVLIGCGGSAGDLNSQESGSSPAVPTETAIEAAVAGITPDDFREIIGTIAHDSMRGRDTPSPELVETAEYIAAKFQSFGLAPGNGDSYQQVYPLTMTSLGPAAGQAMTVRGPATSVELAYEEDFVTVATGGDLRADGSMVLIESLQELGAASGGIAVMAVDQGSLRRALGGGLISGMNEHGVRGMVIAMDVPEAFFRRIARFAGGSRLAVGEPEPSAGPIVMVRRGALPEDLAAALWAGEDAADWTVDLRSSSVVTREEAMNTMGLLEGSDPELKNEYIVFTAHMDHVGVGQPVDGDSIYNGADDDASGTASIVELAEAFASLETRPRRSMVFMTVSGEEKGLLGSEWYSEHPVYPLEETVANLNMDMVGRNWEDRIAAIGKDQSSLGELVDGVSAAHPELSMEVIDDQWPGENFYYRSDHYNFARKGVPILFFFNGDHEDYHQVTDHADKIGYDKISRISRLVFYLGLAIAQDDDRPVWDPAAYEEVVGQAPS